MTAFVMFGGVHPGSVFFVLSLCAVLLVFAPQPAIRSKRVTVLVCLAAVLALAGCAHRVVHAHAVYVPYACSQDQGSWAWWLLCQMDSL